MALLHGTSGLSASCDCGISLAYSLTFSVFGIVVLRSTYYLPSFSIILPRK